MTMKTLYITDMDGTLLNGDSRVSRKTADTISALSRHGALITVATARTAATVVPLLADTYTAVPAVVMTGAALWERTAARYTGVRYIDAARHGGIESICRSVGLHPFVYVLGDDDRMLSVFHDGHKLTRAEQAFYDERCALELKRFYLRSSVPVAHRTVLFYAMGGTQAIAAAARMLEAAGGLSVSCYPDIFDTGLSHLEIFAPGVSKASAVTALKAATEADRLVVFGDNLNDLPMLAAADVAVAVDNALPEVKAAADIVIGTNDSDAVARFIESDFAATV